MKVLFKTFFLLLLAVSSFAQSNLPSNLSTFNAFRLNPLSINLKMPSGYNSSHLPIVSETWTSGANGAKTSYTPTTTISGDTIKINLTASQINQLAGLGTARLLVKFNGIYRLGADIRISTNIGTPSTTTTTVNLPDLGLVNINLIGDASASSQYAAQAKVQKDSAIIAKNAAIAAAASVTVPSTIPGNKLFPGEITTSGMFRANGGITTSAITSTNLTTTANVNVGTSLTVGGSINAGGNVLSTAKHIASGSWDGGAGQMQLGSAGQSGALTMLRGSDGGAGFNMGYTAANSSGDFKIQAVAGNLNLQSSAGGQVIVNSVIKAPIHLAGTDTLATKKDVQKNQFTGANVLILGTSLTANFAPNSYPELASRMLGAANIYNRSIGGSKIIFNGSSAGFSGTTAENSPYDASVSYQTVMMPYLSSPYSCKLIILEYGFNDIPYFPGALGTISSTDKATFYGAYDFIIKQILATAPDAKIVLVSYPSKYPFGGVSSLASYESGLTALSDLGKKWSLPFLNLAEVAGYNTITSVAGQYVSDGVHPFQTNSNKLAYILYRFLLGVN